jgi:TolB-like protein/tRNA A-37 threonylcarbamoyl transferase component Bud32
MPLSAGDKLGPYEILALIGAGGMGEVWKARDTRLNRTVAIKRLTGQYFTRFEQEARAIAALNHPHICVLHDMGPDYLVMELVEGETLAARLKRGSLPLDLALKFGAQMADALAAAHVKGIVHRDVKPANVMIASTGVKLLDFGIAKRDADETQTASRVAVGTPSYMSPEQREGKACDYRSDIYSLGLVLREMATGSRAGTMAGLPAAFVHIVERCLAFEPVARWQSAADIREELDWATKSPPKDAPIDSLAVMPFENVGGNPDTEYLSDGITETLINSLSRISSLRVVSRSRVFRYKGKEIDAVQTSKELNVRALLTGRVSLRGDAMRLQAELVEAATETQLWGERFHRTLIDIFEVEQEISEQITRNLQLRLSGEDKRALAGRYKGSPDAYQFFLRGQHHSKRRTPGSIFKALECFQEAIRLDPRYAMAYEGLAKCNLVLSLFNAGQPRRLLEQGKEWVTRAVELEPASGNSRATMALLFARADWDWVRANAEIEKALQLSPEDFQVHDSAALVFAAQGCMGEALSEIRKALELDPLGLQLQHHAAWFFVLDGQFAQVLEQTRQMIELDSGYPFAHLWRGIALERLSRYDEAEAALRKALELFGGGPLPPFDSVLAHCLGVAGREREARDILEKLEYLSQREYVEPFGLCLIHLGLGEHEEALRNLEAGADVRSAWSTMHLMSDSRLNPLRSAPRFRQLLARMGLN